MTIVVDPTARSTGRLHELPGERELSQLGLEALAHPLMQHPWWKQLEARTLDREQLHAFLVGQHALLAWMPRFLRAAQRGQHSARCSRLFQAVLDDELGFVSQRRPTADGDLRDGRRVDESPRAILFRAWCRDCGVRSTELAQPPQSVSSARASFLERLNDADPAEAIGALSLGFEFVEPFLADLALKGLQSRRLPGHDAGIAFYRAVRTRGAHRRRWLRDIALRELARGGTEALRRGMKLALDLRLQALELATRDDLRRAA